MNYIADSSYRELPKNWYFLGLCPEQGGGGPVVSLCKFSPKKLVFLGKKHIFWEFRAPRPPPHY